MYMLRGPQHAHQSPNGRTHACIAFMTVIRTKCGFAVVPARLCCIRLYIYTTYICSTIIECERRKTMRHNIVLPSSSPAPPHYAACNCSWCNTFARHVVVNRLPLGKMYSTHILHRNANDFTHALPDALHRSRSLSLRPDSCTRMKWMDGMVEVLWRISGADFA